MRHPPDNGLVLICFRCAEPILPNEASLNNRGRAQHYDCLVRAVIGGVNHQRGVCACNGGTQPDDPPSLSKREAARVATIFYRRREKAAQ